MSISLYYQRFKQVLEDDLDLMLTEVDPAKRNHKVIKSLLDLLDECYTKMDKVDAREDLDWDSLPLSEATKAKILELIDQERGDHENQK